MLRLLLTLTIAILTLVSSHAASTVEIDGLNYSIDDATFPSSATLTGSTSGRSIKTLVIPTEVKYNGRTYSVTSIGWDAFHGCTDLTELTIPNSVTYIGVEAFHGCTGLTELTIPNSVTSIGVEAFNGCTGLTKLTIGNSVTFISWSAFSGCTGLTELTIGNSVTSIDDAAFSGCTGLTELTIPNSVTSIGGFAFSGCTGLTKLTIGNSVTSIGNDAFSGCIGLTELTIPNSVTTIGESAFSDCTGLTEVTIGHSVTSIGRGAFAYCKILSVVAQGVTPSSIEEDSFSSDTYKYCMVSTPNNCLSSYREAWPKFTHFIEGGGLSREYNLAAAGDLIYMVDLAELNKIGSLKLSGKINGTDLLCVNKMPNITSLDLSAATIVAGGMPFYEEDNIKYETADNTLGKFWSYNLNCLATIKLPKSLRTIGESAMAGKKYIKAMVIPNSVTSIGEYAFSDCTDLTALTIPDAVREIESYAFSGCSGLTEVTLPGSLRKIGGNAFEGCTALSSITAINPIPAVIESNSFPDYSAKLTVPEGSKMLYFIHPYWGRFLNLTTGIGNVAQDFAVNDVTYHITSEKDATVEVTALNAAANASRSNAGISITIPATIALNGKEYRVAGIANNGSINSNVTSISLPATIGYIGVNAFTGCANLTTFECKAVVPPSADVKSFDETAYASVELYVPENGVKAYSAHDVWGKFGAIKPGTEEDKEDGIKDVESNATDAFAPTSPYKVFNLAGQYLGENLENLHSGLYIVRQNGKSYKIRQ